MRHQREEIIQTVQVSKFPLSSTFAHFNTLICAARSPIERPRRIDPTTLALAPGSGPSNGLRPPGPAH